MSLSPSKSVLNGKALSGNPDMIDWLISLYNDGNNVNRALKTENKTLQRSLDIAQFNNATSFIVKLITLFSSAMIGILANLLAKDTNSVSNIILYIILIVLILAIFIATIYLPDKVKKIGPAMNQINDH